MQRQKCRIYIEKQKKFVEWVDRQYKNSYNYMVEFLRKFLLDIMCNIPNVNLEGGKVEWLKSD